MMMKTVRLIGLLLILCTNSCLWGALTFKQFLAKYGKDMTDEGVVEFLQIIQKEGRHRNVDWLFEALKVGSQNILGNLVGNGYDINSCDALGETPLFKAAKKGDGDMVDFLIRNLQADPSIANLKGKKPYDVVPQGSKYDSIRSLLAANDNSPALVSSSQEKNFYKKENHSRQKNRYQYPVSTSTAIEPSKTSQREDRNVVKSAVSTPPPAVESVRQQRAIASSSNLPKIKAQIPFFQSIENFLRRYRDENVTKDIVKNFLEKQSFLQKEEKKNFEMSFFFRAAEKNALSILKALLDSGFKKYVNMPDEGGETPLFYAVRKGNIAAVELLIDNGASVAYINNAGKSVAEVAREAQKYISAYKKEDYDFIEALLYSVELVPRELVQQEKVAVKEVFFKDRFDEALLKGDDLQALKDEREQFIKAHLSIYDLLKTKPTDQERDYTLTPLQKVIKTDDQPFSIRDSLLEEKKEHADTYQEEVKSVLTQAIVYGASGIFTTVRRGFLEIPITYKDTEGHTLLHWAAIKNREKLAQELLRLGIAVDEQNDDGKTPLIMAAQNGHEAMVNLLLKNGANSNKQALKNFEVIFKDNGASMMIKDDDNRNDVLQGGEVAFGEKGGKGRTALHMLIRMTEGAIKKHGKQLTEQRAVPIAQSLMAAGADMYIEDFPWGLTPLDWVIHNNQEELFNVLIEGRKKQLGIPDVVVTKDKKTDHKGKEKA